MARHQYKLRTHEIGQRLLALRNQTGLTQTELGQLIGVSRRSILKWEGGEGVPNGTHLGRLLEVFVDRKAFTVSQEIAEAEVLWEEVSQAATKRLGLFNKHWFEQLLSGDQGRRSEDTPTVQPEQAALSDHDDPHARSLPGSRPSRLPVFPMIDWGEAIVVPALYGRESEIETLQQWVVADHCRVVAVVGLGGIGKSSLATTFARQFVASFDSVLFRSLQNGPPLAEVLDQIIHAISNQSAMLPQQMPDKIALLVQLFRERRCLLILDNLEAIMQPGALTGTYRTGYSEYGTLLHALSEREHQSCLLLTSREKPTELGPLEGRTAPVHTLHLSGLADSACQLILEEKEIVGTATQVSMLARLYGGNPLALMLVAEPIRALFDGSVGAFLAIGDAFFNGVGKLLAQQLARATPLEQTILYWLAIERELVPFDVLLANLGQGVPQRALLVALESLRHRMLIERSIGQPAFTVQPVICEYVTDQLVEIICQELVDGKPRLLHSHALVQATAKDYVRRSQERLIATPLLEQLIAACRGSDALQRLLLSLFASWREQPLLEQGYGPGNVINLLRLLRGDLRGLDLTGLSIRQAYLQNVDMQDTRLVDSVIQDSTFTEHFDIITAVAISSTGDYWVAGSQRGDMRVWRADGLTLHHMWRAHTDLITPGSFVFTADGRTLASGSADGTMKLWDVTSGGLLWSGKHTGVVYHLAISPDGSMLASLASGGSPGTTFWNLPSGGQALLLPQSLPVISVVWSTDGRLLATGDLEGCVRVWTMPKTEPAICVQTFAEHTHAVVKLAFSPDGSTLASASWDGTVKLWCMTDTRPSQTLAGHADRVNTITWSPDGRTLASGSRDRTIRLWDVEQGNYRAVLQGHGGELWGLVFTPDSRSLLSSSQDGTVRVWDAANGQCTRVTQGYAISLYDVDWSPDGRYLVHGGSDASMTLWNVAGGAPPRLLHTASTVVCGVGWSPDDRWVASNEWDNAIRLWDPTTGVCLQVLRPSDPTVYSFFGLIWSPDGQRLASGTYRRGVQMFDLAAQQQYWLEAETPTWMLHLAWSPNGARLAGCGDDGTVYVWDAAEGALLQRLTGHHSFVKSVAWSADGTRLASGGSGSTGGELFMWDPHSGECTRTFVGHSAIVTAIAWDSARDLLISGGSDGTLRWWDVQSGECVRVREAHQGTVQALRRSPDGTRLASCGDDGAVMLWDPHSGEHLQTLRRDRPYERMDISGLSGITPTQRASLIALGAVDTMSDG